MTRSADPGIATTEIVVTRGDITGLRVDAIVNAANPALAGGGGVDGAIHRAAGPELLRASLAQAPCPPGEARLTPGFRLPARFVIHAVGPIWRGGDLEEAAILAGAHRSSLDLATGAGARTIAFPAISTGIYGYPKRAAAAVAVRTIREWLLAHPYAMDAVMLVAFSGDDAAILEAAAGIRAEVA